MEGRKDHIKLWSIALVCGIPYAKTSNKTVTAEFGTTSGNPKTTAVP
jgi:hypothetical protein